MNKIWITATALMGILCSPIGASANEGVLVFGGTGQLGSKVAIALVSAGEDVTVFTRPTSNRERLAEFDVAYITGDVLNEADVEAALKSGPYRVVVDALARDQGVDAAFYIDSMNYISKWANETGVKQVILHGSVGAGVSRLSDRNPLAELRDLMVAKDIGERFLMESGAPYTIIRNWGIVPEPVTQSGNAFMTTDQSARGLISRDALAGFTVECVDNGDCVNEIFHTVDDDVEAPANFAERLREQRAWEASQ